MLKTIKPRKGPVRTILTLILSKLLVPFVCKELKTNLSGFLQKQGFLFLTLFNEILRARILTKNTGLVGI